jgi:RecA/RadA recombinase
MAKKAEDKEEPEKELTEADKKKVAVTNVMDKINKQKKTIKITYLSEAKSFLLKRFFSGSIGVDYVTGGGFAYKRIQLLFGARSSGKNALLNQTIAFMQRMCRVCHGVLPHLLTNGIVPVDMHTFVLKKIMGYGTCTCSNPIPKKVLILDYERALAIEEARNVKIPCYINASTGQEVDGLDYNDAVAFLQEMSHKEKITDKQSEKIAQYEKLLSNIKIEEKIIQQISTTDYLLKCGVNPKALLVADPSTTEEGIQIVKEYIQAKDVDLIGWDSIQAAIPAYVEQRGADEATMGVEAKQNGLLMRHICSSFAAHDLTDESEAYKPAVIITSQVRAKIGGFTSAPDTYSGGNALQHHISLALELKREKFLKADGTDAEFKDNFYGQTIRIRADKNKLGSPGDLHQYDYYFREGDTFPIGIDFPGELINLGIALQIIDRAGPYYSFKGQRYQGMKSLKESFREQPQYMHELYLEIMSRK